MADIRFIPKKSNGSTRDLQGFDRRRAEYLAKPVTKKEKKDRRTQARWADLEFLAGLAEQSGPMGQPVRMEDIEKIGPMNKGLGKLGSGFTRLGYFGSPNSDEEGQVRIAQYKGPMGGRNTRTFGLYIPKAPANASQKAINREMAKDFRHFSFLGDPPTVGDVAVDATSQRSGKYPDPRADFGETLYHEFKHRGLNSESLEKLKDSLSGASPLSKEFKLLGKISRFRYGAEQHAVFDTIEQLEKGKTTYEELSEKDKRRLYEFADVEQALLDSFTEEESLKLGIFPPKAPPNRSKRFSLQGAIDSITRGPVEIPESFRAGGRVRLI